MVRCLRVPSVFEISFELREILVEQFDEFLRRSDESDKEENLKNPGLEDCRQGVLNGPVEGFSNKLSSFLGGLCNKEPEEEENITKEAKE